MSGAAKAWEAIRDGYPMEAQHDCVFVENPDFSPDNGQNPWLMLSMEDIRALVVKIGAIALFMGGQNG